MYLLLIVENVSLFSIFVCPSFRSAAYIFIQTICRLLPIMRVCFPPTATELFIEIRTEREREKKNISTRLKHIHGDKLLLRMKQNEAKNKTVQ